MKFHGTRFRYYLNLIGYVDPVQQNSAEEKPVSALKKDFSVLSSVEKPSLKKDEEKEIANERPQQEKTFTVNTPKYLSTVSANNIPLYNSVLEDIEHI